ncbi:MAG: leucine-rich repeat domain-containing protein [Paludibacteraceae bacterium]|nr:leucine-rich repeat domain-containing protein [Paludibacteraceae bacterium]
MRKTKLFSLLAVLLCAASANVVFAQTTINHVNYEFDEDAKTATVVGADYTWEDTDVSLVIPAQVEYNSQNYAVTAIGDNAFREVEYLVSIELPEGLLSIGDAAFNQTYNLASINIPNSVTSVGEEAFAGAFIEDYLDGENAIDIVLGNGLTVLSKWMFSSARMKSVTLQEGLLEIKEGAFQSCGYLTSITIPSTVTHIWGDGLAEGGDGDAFESCKKLTDIYCYANPANLTWDDTNSDDFIASPAKTTRCHVKSCELAAFQAKFAHVNVTFVGDLPCAAPATPETSDNVDGIETAMEALVTAGGTTDLIINRELFKDGSFNTLCLPFSLTEAELAASPLAGCKLYSLSDADDNGDNLYLTITEESTIEAGMPYLIKWTYGSNITSMTFNDVTVTASTGSTVTKGDVQFVGTIGRSELPHGNADYLFLGANDNLYYSDDSDDTSMKGFRAYFVVNNASETVTRHAPARLVIAPKMPTAVENVQGDNVQSTKVIENGQLYIIKNGVKYNAQGKVVK